MILRPGTFLQDRYEILEQIGSGGMSVVYKAKCYKLNRLVAIKVLKEEFCNDSNFVSKFKMEAQAAAGLSHPNIVSVYDVMDEGSIHYIVMELIEGITLKSYIAKKEKLEIKESIGIAIQVAQGIAAAHEQHIIHRDIKPQNMIISKDGKVKVADFGIARAVSEQTLNSTAMGSVHYISPEQARGGFSDERSDIYSLGVTMYEMVTGRVPFEGGNTVSIALAHLEDAVVPPGVYNREISAGLEQIILRCMEKKPEWRYASANDVIADLRGVLIHPDGSELNGLAGTRGLDGETVQLSSEELAQIKERKGAELRRSLAKEYQEEAITRKPYQPDRNPEISLQNEQKKKDRNGGDEVNPHIERLMAGAGIVAAIIIVSILIAVFLRLGGLFQSGSGTLKRNPKETDEITTLLQGSSDLKDTEVYMPDLKGLTEDEAQSRLKENFLTMKRSYEYFDDIEKGLVVSQNPEPGEVALKGGYVNVVISNGSDKISLAQLGIGKLDAEAAKSLLEEKDINVMIVQEESEIIEKGKILRYEPELVPEGGTATLYISSGPHVDMAAVPYLVGKPEEEAIALLTENGLLPGDTEVEPSDTVARGLIISQEIKTGTQVETGTKVNYVISSGQEVHRQRYVASINQVYDLSSLIGPGAGTSSVTLMIRLRQGTVHEPHYKILTQATSIKGDVLLPVSFTSIESIDGTDQGELEIVDVDSGQVVQSYPLTFFPMD